MAKRNRNKTKLSQFWQSAQMNADYTSFYLNWLSSLAQLRFKWEGLPESCNPRYLEQKLLYEGFACFARDGAESPVYSIGILQDGAQYNAYGDFTNFEAVGFNLQPRFHVENEVNGVLVRNSNSFASTWQGMQIIASQMARVKRTLDTNMQLQQTPFAITAPKEKQLEAINTYKQISGYEPAVIATPDYWQNVKIEAIQTGVPFIGNDLIALLFNLWHEGLTFLGIENLQHEKRAQMTEEETEGDASQTELRLLDALEPRRYALERANELFGWNATVVYNEDVESKAASFESMLTAGLQEGGEDGGMA